MNSSSRVWISVVIPIKDERDNIPLLTSQLLKFLENREETQHAPFEILFVDDGSTDGGGALLDNLSQQHQVIQVFHLEKIMAKRPPLMPDFVKFGASWSPQWTGISNMILLIWLSSYPLWASTT